MKRSGIREPAVAPEPLSFPSFPLENRLFRRFPPWTVLLYFSPNPYLICNLFPRMVTLIETGQNQMEATEPHEQESSSE